MRLIKAVHIEHSSLLVDGKQVYTHTDNTAFLKGAYTFLEMNYIKFFKMDAPCKLATLASTCLDQNTPDIDFSGDKTAVLLATKSGCIESDIKHVESYRDPDQFFPSPAVFVYTLPNIMVGEICIKHKITGESACYMMENYDLSMMTSLANDLFAREKYRYCVLGWVDSSKDGQEAHLALYEKEIE